MLFVKQQSLGMKNQFTKLMMVVKIVINNVPELSVINQMFHHYLVS